jgi:hypothetical protein
MFWFVYCRTAVGGSVTGATGDNCVIGGGGWTGISEPVEAGGIIGLPDSSPANGAAATATAFGAGGSVTRVEFRDNGPVAAGPEFDVLAPAAGAAGTGLPPGNGIGGAIPPTGVIPPLGCALN